MQTFFESVHDATVRALRCTPESLFLVPSQLVDAERDRGTSIRSHGSPAEQHAVKTGKELNPERDSISFVGSEGHRNGKQGFRYMK